LDTRESYVVFECFWARESLNQREVGYFRVLKPVFFCIFTFFIISFST